MEACEERAGADMVVEAVGKKGRRKSTAAAMIGKKGSDQSLMDAARDRASQYGGNMIRRMSISDVLLPPYQL